MKKALLVVLNTISVVLILLSILVLLTVVMTRSGEVPDLLGYSAFRVTTGSMEPTLPVDSLIITRKTHPADIREGNIITFYSRDPALDGAANTHRVVAVVRQEDGTLAFRTRGDGNMADDAYLTVEGDVIGVVVACSPLMGKVIHLASNPLIFFPFLILPLAFLLIANVFATVKAAGNLAREDEEAAFRRVMDYERKARDPQELGERQDSEEAIFRRILDYERKARDPSYLGEPEEPGTPGWHDWGV